MSKKQKPLPEKATDDSSIAEPEKKEVERGREYFTLNCCPEKVNSCF